MCFCVCYLSGLGFAGLTILCALVAGTVSSILCVALTSPVSELSVAAVCCAGMAALAGALTDFAGGLRVESAAMLSDRFFEPGRMSAGRIAVGCFTV